MRLIVICIWIYSIIHMSSTVFTPRIYLGCNRHIYLRSSEPAAKINIGRISPTPFLSEVEYCSMSVSLDNEEYRIGILLLDHGVHKVECLSFQQSCPCITSPFILRLNEEQKLHKFCNAGKKGEVDTNIVAQRLEVWWNNTEMPSQTMYSILVFRLKQHCYISSSEVTNCPGISRCIDNSLICTPPYKYCGDNTNLCQGNAVESESAPSIVPVLVIIPSFIVIISLVIVCFVCSRKTNNCINIQICCTQTSHLHRETLDNFTTTPDSSQIQMTHSTIESAGNTVRSAAVKAAFTMDPPEYDSLETGHDSDREVNTTVELPPSYDMVISHISDYKVNAK